MKLILIISLFSLVCNADPFEDVSTMNEILLTSNSGAQSCPKDKPFTKVCDETLKSICEPDPAIESYKKINDFYDSCVNKSIDYSKYNYKVNEKTVKFNPYLPPEVIPMKNEPIPGTMAQNSEELDGWAYQYVQYMKYIDKQVLTDRSSLQGLFEEMKLHSKNSVSGLKIDQVVKDDFNRELKDTVLLSASEFINRIDVSIDSRSGYITSLMKWCGADGSALNAFETSIGTDNVVVLCPGTIINALKDTSKCPGGSVDKPKISVPQKKSEQELFGQTKIEPVSTSVYKNTAVIEQQTNAVLNADKTPGDGPLDYMKLVNTMGHEIGHIYDPYKCGEYKPKSTTCLKQIMRPEFNKNYACYVKQHPDEKYPLEMMAENLADLFGAESTASYIKTEVSKYIGLGFIDEKSALNDARSMIGSYCNDSLESHDGTTTGKKVQKRHPLGNDRITTFYRNPRVRTALNCGTFPKADTKVCTLEGETTVK